MVWIKILDLGCGANKWKSKGDTVIGIDCVKMDGIDVVWDINKIPLPFKDGEFDVIITRHVLEHITELPKMLDELHRILKIGGKLRIWVPHYSSPLAYTCPEHVKFFSIQMFDFYYPKERAIAPSYWDSNPGFRLTKKRLNYTAEFATNSAMKALGNILNPIINWNHKFFEKFLAGIIICDECYFELTKISSSKSKRKIRKSVRRGRR